MPDQSRSGERARLRFMMNILPSLLSPPADVPEIQRGDWFPLSTGDPVVAYVSAHLWHNTVAIPIWKIARLSKTAYAYRETTTGWKVVVKYYSVKTGQNAEKYAQREFNVTRDARSPGRRQGDFRAVEALSAWRGLLFLEYIDGLTLEDVIAVRRSRPGTLLPSLERTARFLAHLHTNAPRPEEPVHFDWEVNDTWDILDNLFNHGILEGNPTVQDGVELLLNRWTANPHMTRYTPVLNHGDATTSNFIFTSNDELVAVDWERARPADPAADLGRLMAEVSHSLSQHGGSVAEALPFIQHLETTYHDALPEDWETDALLERARFYQAASTLRIARNGWVSRLDRMALVAQALALLS